MGLMTSGRRVLALVPAALLAVVMATLPVNATSPAIDLLIAGEDNGPAADELRFQAADLFAGHSVVLFIVRGTEKNGNKRLVSVREKIVPDDGYLTFATKDRNRNRKTRFVAKSTIDGQTYKSNTQHVR